MDAASPTPRVAVDPTLTYVAHRRTASVIAEALVEARARRGRRDRRPLPRRASCSAPATSRRSPTSPPRPTARRATPCCPPTSSPPRTAPASCTPRSPSARTTSGSARSRALHVVNPVRLDGTYDERIGPYAGRWVKDADRGPDRGPARARPAAPRRGLRALLSALLALRHAAALLRQAVLVHRHHADERPPAGRQRVGQLVPRARQARALRQLAGEQRRLGALARALLGHAAAGLALRRPARRRRSARSPSSSELSGVRLEDPHRPFVDDVEFPCADAAATAAPRPRGDRRLVRLGRDAVRPVARAARERRSTSSERFPADFICEALDQTRGWFYSLLAVSTLLFDQSPVPQRPLPRADPRRAGPKMSKSLGQHRRAVGRDRPARRRRVALVLLHLQAAVGRLPVLARHDRRVASASSCCSSGTPTASTSCTRTPTTSRRARRARPTELDRWALSRLHATTETVRDRLDALRRHARRPRDRSVRRRALQLVRAPLARGASGTATRPRSRRCTTAW